MFDPSERFTLKILVHLSTLDMDGKGMLASSHNEGYSASYALRLNLPTISWKFKHDALLVK